MDQVAVDARRREDAHDGAGEAGLRGERGVLHRRPRRLHEDPVLGVHDRRLVAADAEEAVVELVRVVDHVRHRHEVLVVDRVLRDALPAHEVLRQERRRHRSAPQALPERVHAVRAREPPGHADDGDALGCPRGLARETPTLHGLRCGLGALNAQQVEQCSERRVRVDVEDRERQAVVVRELRGDLGGELRVASEVKEVLLQVQGAQAQVQSLRPYSLNDRLDTALLRGLVEVRHGSGGLRRSLRRRLAAAQLVEHCQARELPAVELPGLGAGGAVLGHRPEVRGHHPTGDLLRSRLLHALHHSLERSALLRADEAQQAVDDRGGLVHGNDCAQADALHILDRALYKREAHLEAPDLYGAVHAAPHLEQWRLAHEASHVPGLVPLPRPHRGHLRKQRVNEPLCSHSRLLIVTR
mmetsp:Transcript_114201/g.329861  ORF Transcript_114201/g.329861 Transcript_114201/m.329861 type:complete len:413 (+) Transcript_114201:294-1532(+)